MVSNLSFGFDSIMHLEYRLENVMQPRLTHSCHQRVKTCARNLALAQTWSVTGKSSKIVQVVTKPADLEIYVMTSLKFHWPSQENYFILCDFLSIFIVSGRYDSRPSAGHCYVDVEPLNSTKFRNFSFSSFSSWFSSVSLAIVSFNVRTSLFTTVRRSDLICVICSCKEIEQNIKNIFVRTIQH